MLPLILVLISVSGPEQPEQQVDEPSRAEELQVTRLHGSASIPRLAQAAC